MVFAAFALVFAACKAPGSVSIPVTVTFNGNGHTDGMVIPSALLGPAGLSMPLAVQGSLVKTAYTFRGWNTQANGSGLCYTNKRPLYLLNRTPKFPFFYQFFSFGGKNVPSQAQRRKA
jgi:hypothetical protein